MKIILQMFQGFCMALADSVPGVSGGTVAFLMGFYDQFIDSIDDLLTGSMAKKKEALCFLVKLGLGWAIGMISAVLILTSVFEAHIYAISSLFVGFIIFAIPVVAWEEKEALQEKKAGVLFAVLGVAIVCLITYLNSISSGSGINLDHMNLKVGIMLFLAGMIAISAMVLPGISGSTILLIMGLYLPIITAIKELLHLNFSVFPMVFVFGCGVLVGIFSVVKLIRKALENFRPQTVYLILGLMIGSIYAVIMGPTTLETPQPALSVHEFRILFFLIGGIVILGLQKLKGVKEGKSEEAAGLSK